MRMKLTKIIIWIKSSQTSSLYTRILHKLIFPITIYIDAIKIKNVRRLKLLLVNKNKYNFDYF